MWQCYIKRIGHSLWNQDVLRSLHQYISNAFSNIFFILTSFSISCSRANVISLAIISLLIFSFFSPWRNASLALVDIGLGKTVGISILPGKQSYVNSHPRNELMWGKISFFFLIIKNNNTNGSSCNKCYLVMSVQRRLSSHRQQWEEGTVLVKVFLGFVQHGIWTPCKMLLERE